MTPAPVFRSPWPRARLPRGRFSLETGGVFAVDVVRVALVLGLVQGGLCVQAPGSRAADRATAAAAAPAGTASARIAIVVGANAAAPGRKPLLYGHRDAESVADALSSVGGFRPENVHLLRDPSGDALLGTLHAAITQLDGQPESMLYFYYSGHADEQAIYPAGRPLAFTKVRDLLDSAKVSVRIGMIDACRGGSWTRAKGLLPAEPFSVRWPLSLDNEGSVLIASSTGIESAHESDDLQGSFFTHHFVVGLRGGADRNDNGEVTLTEAFEYAKERTIRDSLRTAREIQHPSYAVNLRGRHDLVLAQIAAGPSTVELTQHQGPLELIHVQSGVELLELPAGPHRVKLSVPPGQYLIRKQAAAGSVLVKEVAVKAGVTTLIEEDQLTLVGTSRLSAKAASLAPAFSTVPGMAAAPPAADPAALAASPAPTGVAATPSWVKFVGASSLVVAVGALAIGIKFNRDVSYYDQLIDPLRRFPCNADDRSYSCDRDGKEARPLRAVDLEYRQSLADDGKKFQGYSFIAFGTAAAFGALAAPFIYRWIRGEKPESAPRGSLAHSLVLAPTAAGRPGLSALGRF